MPSLTIEEKTLREGVAIIENYWRLVVTKRKFKNKRYYGLIVSTLEESIGTEREVHVENVNCASSRFILNADEWEAIRKNNKVLPIVYTSQKRFSV